MEVTSYSAYDDGDKRFSLVQKELDLQDVPGICVVEVGGYYGDMTNRLVQSKLVLGFSGTRHRATVEGIDYTTMVGLCIRKLQTRALHSIAVHLDRKDVEQPESTVAAEEAKKSMAETLAAVIQIFEINPQGMETEALVEALIARARHLVAVERVYGQLKSMLAS